MNELARKALERFVKEEDPDGITENGFTVRFEDEVLKSAAEPRENDIVPETDEDIKAYFLDLKKEIRKQQKNDKGHLQR